MENCSAVLKLLLIITCVHLSSSGRHSLQYLYTAAGRFIAVSLVDEEQVVSYDSKIGKMIPRTEWMKKIEDDDPLYWKSETQHMTDQHERIRVFVHRAKQIFNHTKDHIVLKMYGCELDDDNTTGGYDQYSYDGEDFINLNLTTGTWTADNDKAKSFINDWDPKGTEAKHWKDFLETNCIDQLKKFVSQGRESLERKEVVCHATGFFPKALNITWQKDGEDVHEDVELRETLPNQDESFQKRIILKVPAEELQKHTYTCVVQHSSLEKELVREVPKGGRSAGVRIAIITPVVAALIGLFAGIVVWKNKNSGERRKEADVKFSENRFTLSNS
ncbi:DLA class I histocompatibility antigen, A9/A9 alpha chain-like isoform 2-T3 [Clarias gariepinus]|uniref:DLA class I histocompatibility antigen, A9/A9 alpha chain-like isoform X2 n=1 Tax=Clarias gariepinus TaxID=13013 RepID=UPI00234DB161|nr:DLA class I histocompatibility antigen, A9/A9 alpha chain-like isoform X2 [Clarias gariepinus]